MAMKPVDTIDSTRTQEATRFVRMGLPNAPPAARKLRVLVLDEELPYPPNAGKRIRTWNLLQQLARRHSITLLCYGHANEAAVKALERAGITVSLIAPKKALSDWHLYLRLFANVFSPFPFSVTKHYSSRFRRKLDNLLKDRSWDLIQCEWTPYARFIPNGCAVPVLVTAHNIESEILARRARHSKSSIAKAFFYVQEWKMRRFERRCLVRSSAATAVTRRDAMVMRGWGVKSIKVVPNGVDLLACPATQDNESENEILLLASLDWYPNVDSVEYFLREIFPIVRQGRPDATLRIVGRRPSEALMKRCSRVPGVIFVGEVADVYPHLARAAAFVVPLRIGGGSRLKILEALAAGKAVVSTSIGVEGLELASGKHLIIADSPTEFALSVERILASTPERRLLGSQGRLHVEAHHSWSAIARRLEQCWHRVSQLNTYTRVAIDP
jgi:glycosyltransferase involved in cell wall biosynthesis